MPVLLYLVYRCMLWSVWYETITGRRPTLPTAVSVSAVQNT